MKKRLIVKIWGFVCASSAKWIVGLRTIEVANTFLVVKDFVTTFRFMCRERNWLDLQVRDQFGPGPGTFFVVVLNKDQCVSPQSGWSSSARTTPVPSWGIRTTSQSSKLTRAIDLHSINDQPLHMHPWITTSSWQYWWFHLLGVQLGHLGA